MTTEVRFHRGATVLLAAALLATLTVALTGGNRADAVEGPVEVVYVATGQNFPDALAGANLAATVGAPMLTVNQGLPIPDATITALDALDPTQIIILGGPVAVSEPVADALAAHTRSGEVTRIEGGDRHETAARIADALPSRVHDADKLDGLDAAAFLRSTGTAVDSEALDGRAASDLRVMPLGGWTYASAGTTVGDTGPVLPADTFDEVGTTFLVPAGHDPADELVIDLVIGEGTALSCVMWLGVETVISRPGSSSALVSRWLGPSGTDDILLTAPQNIGTHALTVRTDPSLPASFLTPGVAHALHVARAGDAPTDTCGPAVVLGAQLRY